MIFLLLFIDILLQQNLNQMIGNKDLNRNSRNQPETIVLLSEVETSTVI